MRNVIEKQILRISQITTSRDNENIVKHHYPVSQCEELSLNELTF